MDPFTTGLAAYRPLTCTARLESRLLLKMGKPTGYGKIELLHTFPDVLGGTGRFSKSFESCPADWAQFQLPARRNQPQFGLRLSRMGKR